MPDNETTLLKPRQIASDKEALEVADELAQQLAGGAIARDRDRHAPIADLDQIAESGILAITVPEELGGPQVAVTTLAEVMRRLAAADPALAQTLLPHYVVAGAIFGLGSQSLQETISEQLLGGARIGNGISERGTKHAWDPQTRLRSDGDGGLKLDGKKYYATGALTGKWIAIAAKNEDDQVVLAIIPRDAHGLTVTEEWTSFGQRATISGPAILEGVSVHENFVLPLWTAFEGPTVGGAFDQILHAAIDVGIARGALTEGGSYVTTRTRPWFESDADSPVEEPEVLQRFGQLATRVRAAEATLHGAAQSIDETIAATPDAENTAATSITVAAAKAFGGEVAVEVSSSIFELAGTSATDSQFGLDRHWRNARTHTLHDPVRWKYRHIGAYDLSGVKPPRHPLI